MLLRAVSAAVAMRLLDPASCMATLQQEINQGYSEDGMGSGGSFGRGGFGGFGGMDEDDLFAHMFAQAGGSRRYSGYPGGAFGGFN